MYSFIFLGLTQISLSQFVNMDKSIYNSPSQLNSGMSGKLLFHFKHTTEAALHNVIVMQCYNFSIDSAIQVRKNSPIYYGPKFQPIHKLYPLLCTHPLWICISSILSKGATFPLLPLPDTI
jgi:hypothetical protein